MADQDYIKLNNLYLAIERKATRLTITNANELRCLVDRIWTRDDPMRDYWFAELCKLPHWFDI